MRVTIEHREESAGPSGSTKNHFVDCTVEFSEEEKAIIKARDLYNHNFRVGPATPISSQAAFVGAGLLNSLGRLGVLSGVVLGILSAFIRGESGTIAGWLLFIGAALWIYAATVMRRQDKRVSEPDQIIKLRNLLDRRRFTVYASSPAQAQTIEEEIRNALTYTKQLLTASAELKAKQTFEL